MLLLNGIIFVVLTFITIMQSQSVLNLFLNLTGLHFLQEIDNACFIFASKGVLGSGIEKACEHVKILNQFVPESMKRRTILIKRAVIVTCTLGLLIPFGIFSGVYQMISSTAESLLLF